MHGLPKATDVSFFVGTRLELVCLAKYQIFLHFSGGVLVTVEGAIKVGTETFAEVSSACLPLFENLEVDVVDAEALGNGSLLLKLSNDVLIEIQDSSSRYESYNISAPGRPTLYI